MKTGGFKILSFEKYVVLMPDSPFPISAKSFKEFELNPLFSFSFLKSSKSLESKNNLRIQGYIFASRPTEE